MALKVSPCMPWTIFRPSGASGSSGSATRGVADTTVLALRPSPTDLCDALIEAIGVVASLQVPDSQQVLDATVAEAVQRSLAAVLRCLEEASAAASWLLAPPALQRQRPPAAGFPGGQGAAVAAARREEGRTLVAALLAADAPAMLVARLEQLCFETRKDAMHLFSTLLKTALPLGADAALVDYLRSHPRISQLLLEGSGRHEVFMHCSQMLRACTRYPQMVTALINEGAFGRLIELACHPSFDISSEAFSSLRELLLAQKEVSAMYLKFNFDSFFAQYHTLFQPARDYVSRRQALRLLGDVLLDRAFVEVMLAYVENEQFLQIHMNLLRDSSKTIQVDAFHVFKIFVANPNKPYKVVVILHRNRDRLLRLLGTLTSPTRAGGCSSNALFDEDLAAVTEVLKGLEPPPRVRPSNSSGSFSGSSTATPESGGHSRREIEEVEATPNFVEAS